MACAFPRRAWLRASGGRAVFSEPPDSLREIWVDCGQCALCRTALASDRATRLCHEAHCHAFSAVVTLTIDDEHLDAAASCDKRSLQLFLKRLRRSIAGRGKGAAGVRFSGIGEYSPVLLRPHFHAILYGYWPADAKPFGKSQSGNPQYTSDTLTRLWGRGHVTFQPFTAAAATYIARHDAWKVTKGESRSAVPIFDGPSGEFVGHREPEFYLSSRRPGLGAPFFDRYGEQMLRLGFTVLPNGSKVAVPSYYLRFGESRFPDLVSELRAKRELEARDRWADSTFRRLADREACAVAALNRRSRDGVSS